MLFEEAPTFLLNCKRYFNIKNKPFELLYGISFILIRIVYQVFMCIQLTHHINSDVLYVVIFNISICAHCKWGYMWIKKYRKMVNEDYQSKTAQPIQTIQTIQTIQNNETLTTQGNIDSQKIQTQLEPKSLDDKQTYNWVYYSIGEKVFYLSKGFVIYGLCLLASQTIFKFTDK